MFSLSFMEPYTKTPRHDAGAEDDKKKAKVKILVSYTRLSHNDERDWTFLYHFQKNSPEHPLSTRVRLLWHVVSFLTPLMSDRQVLEHESKLSPSYLHVNYDTCHLHHISFPVVYTHTYIQFFSSKRWLFIVNLDWYKMNCMKDDLV